MFYQVPASEARTGDVGYYGDDESPRIIVEHSETSLTVALPGGGFEYLPRAEAADQNWLWWRESINKIV
jgi:hypothetical protein